MVIMNIQKRQNIDYFHTYGNIARMYELESIMILLANSCSLPNGVQIPSPASPLEQTIYDDIIDSIKDIMRN
jgi:hypothetical protein